jgi:hypothetical protein
MKRRTALWVAAGVLGIALAAAITWATSQLTSQHIGLSSEPISAARALAPSELERGPDQLKPSGSRSIRAPRRHIPNTSTNATPPVARATTETTASPAAHEAPARQAASGEGAAPHQATPNTAAGQPSRGDRETGDDAGAGGGRHGESSPARPRDD